MLCPDEAAVVSAAVALAEMALIVPAGVPALVDPVVVLALVGTLPGQATVPAGVALVVEFVPAGVPALTALSD